MNHEAPEISIITATYNRSNVLRYAIESVLAQDCPRTWEQWVIGDACTDDTAQVVAGFEDPRIHFHNLPQNIGEQSGPNNEGFRLARGRYIAYLNHDDLWFPDHLRRALEVLEAPGADGVFAMGLGLEPGDRVRLLGASRTGGYHPNLSAAASLWVMRREVLAAIGGWRSCGEIRMIPSQDVLWRAWRAGFRFRMVPAATVICIQSGYRSGVYLNREESENAAASGRMKSHRGYREELLTKALLDVAGVDDALPIWPLARRLAGNLIRRGGLLLGRSPVETTSFFLARRKGGEISRLRRFRGLPPVPKKRTPRES